MTKIYAYERVDSKWQVFEVDNPENYCTPEDIAQLYQDNKQDKSFFIVIKNV